MEMVPVSSSSIAAIGYDEDSQTLQVEFNRGTLYQYFDVPQQIFDELQQANSVGTFLNEHIKGIYRYSKV